MNDALQTITMYKSLTAADHVDEETGKLCCFVDALKLEEINPTSEQKGNLPQLESMGDICDRQGTSFEGIYKSLQEIIFTINAF